MVHSIYTQNPATGSSGSRAEMERYFEQLPDYVKDALTKGELRYADTVIYSLKPITKKIKMFEEKDDRELGMRNISNAKLPKNQCFLLSGIQLLAIWSATPDKEDVLSGYAYTIENIPALGMGEFSLKANQKILIPETSTLVFRSVLSGTFGIPTDYYKLANPILIKDQEQIDFTIEFATLKGLPASYAYIQLSLHGTITTP